MRGDRRRGGIHIRRNAVIGRYEMTVSEDMKANAEKRDVPLSEELELWPAAWKKTSHAKYVIRHGEL